MRIVSVLVVIAGIGNSVAVADPPESDDLERAAVAARTGIRSGYLEFTVTHRDKLDGQPLTQVSERKTWFDGNKVRAEYVYTQGPDQGVRMLECRNCEREGWGITATDRPGIASSFDPLGKPGRPSFRDAVDPRVIGYSTADYFSLATEPIGKIFDSSSASPRTVTPSRDRDVESYDIRWTSKANVAVMVRVVPSRGHNISRIELAFKSEKRSWHVAAVSDLAFHDGVWFPSRVVVTNREGETTTREDVIEVKQFRPNLQLPAELFTLVGAQLKPDAMVTIPNLPYVARIHDGKLDTSPPPQAQFQDTSPPVPVAPPGRQVNPWLVAACVSCAVAAVAVLVFRRRRGA